MSCIQNDFQFTAGDDFVINLTYEDGNPPAPVNITGAEIKMTFKQDPGDADSAAVFQISVLTGDIVITNGPAGQFTVTIPPTVTNGLVWPKTYGFYDIRVKTVGGVIQTMATGTITLNRPISQQM